MIEKKKIFFTNIESIIAILVMLIALGRCFDYQSLPLVLAVCFLTVFLIIIKGSICISIYDLFVCLFLFLMLAHKNQRYSWTMCLYVVLAVMSYFAFRTKKSYFCVLKFCALFSLINYAIDLISLVNVDLYFSIVKPILSSESFENAVYYYKMNGFISGLSDHYSRNAYFCVLGATVFASFFLEEKKHKVTCGIFLAAEILMIMIIGKRGHFLFFLVSLGFVYLLKEPKITKRVSRLIKILLGISLFVGITLELIPMASSFVNRTMLQIASGDVSTGRFDLWTSAWNYFLKKPLLGWGYGFFSTHFYNNTLKVYFAGVHNDYLQWLCEGGLVGFLINITITIGLYSVSLKTYRHIHKSKYYENDDKTLITWSVLFQTFTILYSLTGLPHFDFEINILYWISCSVPMIYIQEMRTPLVKNVRLYWR